MLLCDYVPVFTSLSVCVSVLLCSPICLFVWAAAFTEQLRSRRGRSMSPKRVPLV